MYSLRLFEEVAGFDISPTERVFRNLNFFKIFLLIQKKYWTNSIVEAVAYPSTGSGTETEIVHTWMKDSIRREIYG
ncbi:hypothetical protein EAJ17_09320 [Akkermansia sp. aa_0143]|nr:hypothetical protein EAJ17_09320 [Akkermansia sp. aa_0143]